MSSPSESQSSIMVTFEFFPKLPAELQLKIFKLAVPGPQMIALKTCVPGTYYDLKSHTVQLINNGEEWDWKETLYSAERIRFSTKVPVSGLFRACKTSREAILATYKVAIRCIDGRVIRLDGTKDIVFLYHESPRSCPVLPFGDYGAYPNYLKMFSGVKTLAISLTDLRKSYSNWLVSLFESLQALVIIDHEKWILNAWAANDISQSQIFVLKDRAQLDIAAKEKRKSTESWISYGGISYQVFLAKIKGQDQDWDQEFDAGLTKAVPYSIGLEERDLEDESAQNQPELNSSE